MKSKDERYEKYSKTKKTLAPDHDKQKTPWVNLPYQALEKNESGDTVSRSRGDVPAFLQFTYDTRESYHYYKLFQSPYFI